METVNQEMTSLCLLCVFLSRACAREADLGCTCVSALYPAYPPLCGSEIYFILSTDETVLLLYFIFFSSKQPQSQCNRLMVKILSNRLIGLVSHDL